LIGRKCNSTGVAKLIAVRNMRGRTVALFGRRYSTLELEVAFG
jgi:hypothetical protein